MIHHGRQRTLALIRQLRAIGPLHPTARVLPRQQQPTAIQLAYYHSLAPICEAARVAFSHVQPQILHDLRALRRVQGRLDGPVPLPYLWTPDTYPALLDALRGQLGLGARLRSYGQTSVGPLVVADVPAPAGGPTLVIVTGQHGDEPAGPTMLARYGAAIVGRARALGVGLRIYPCVNPEGFHLHQRRDAEGDRHANSFTEYEVGGRWQGELAPGEVPEQARRPQHQAPETAALHDSLAAWVAQQHPVALLDLHQDSILRAGFAFGYANAGRAALAGVVARAGIPFAGRRLRNGSWTSVQLATGPDGLVDFRDGSVTDWAAAQGVPYSLALEAAAGDLEDAARVHRSAVYGMIDLVAHRVHLDAGGGAIGLGRAAQLGRAARERDLEELRQQRQRAGEVGGDLARAERQGQHAAHLIDRAAQEFARKFHPEQLHALAREFGQKTSAFNREQLDQQTRVGVGVPFSALEKPIRDGIDGWSAANVDLIKTVPERYFDRLRDDVQDAYTSGMSPDVFAEDLAERYDVSLDDARRIARDQIGKLNADVNQARQEALGVDEATWRSMRDNRVCDDCYPLEGEKFPWESPPDGITPGNCHPMDRCYGEPDFAAIING